MSVWPRLHRVGVCAHMCYQPGSAVTGCLLMASGGWVGSLGLLCMFSRLLVDSPSHMVAIVFPELEERSLKASWALSKELQCQFCCIHWPNRSPHQPNFKGTEIDSPLPLEELAWWWPPLHGSCLSPDGKELHGDRALALLRGLVFGNYYSKAGTGLHSGQAHIQSSLWLKLFKMW